MKPVQVAKTVAQAAFEPLETLSSQIGKPILSEAARELGAFFGTDKFNQAPKTIAQEDLQRARNQKRLEQMAGVDTQASQQKHSEMVTNIQNEYKVHQAKVNNEQSKLKDELVELQSEIAQLAKTAGVETNTHLEQTPKKIGILDIKRLTTIVRFLRIKAEESKSAQELVMQRKNAKRPTGMLAWVSGKQMKVHEQGTLYLQG